MPIDEGPSSEDIERFDRDADETAFCPDCGEEIWEGAEICPACYAYIGGKTTHRRAVGSRDRRLKVLIIVITIVAFFVTAMLCFQAI